MGFFGAATTTAPPLPFSGAIGASGSVSRHDEYRKHLAGPVTEYTDRAGTNLRFALATDPWPSGPPAPRLHESRGSRRRRRRGQVPHLHEEPTGVRSGPQAHVLLLLRRPLGATGR